MGEYMRRDMKEILCKNCKHLIWYRWWFPHMGIIVEEKQECDHPKNKDIFKDAVTGKHIDIGYKESPQIINEKRNCKWFESGKHKSNLDGKMSVEDKARAEKYQESMTRSRRRSWWPFW
jgi:hypothetical protein